MLVVNRLTMLYLPLRSPAVKPFFTKLRLCKTRLNFLFANPPPDVAVVSRYFSGIQDILVAMVCTQVPSSLFSLSSFYACSAPQQIF
jgi:hypothetical protein